MMISGGLAELAARKTAGDDSGIALLFDHRKPSHYPACVAALELAQVDPDWFRRLPRELQYEAAAYADKRQQTQTPQPRAA